MNGKFGKNQWKISLLCISGIVVAFAVLIGTGVGVYSYFGPKISDFQEERKERKEKERKEAEKAAKREEKQRMAEEAKAAADEKQMIAESDDGQADEDTLKTAKDKSKTKDEKKAEEDEYIIPDSDSRYLSDSDVADWSIKKINYAKNEIYARRGRKFLSTELQEYFNGKSWYKGTVSPDDFDESVFNEYEKANTNFLSDVEHSIDANGYQPK